MGMNYVSGGDTYRFRYRTDQGEQGVIEFQSKQHYTHLIWGRACVKVNKVGEVISLEVIDWGV
jgi:hypothetical protein